jgi:ABC-type sulfate/molybdate transport systems ATPase subunit
VAVAVAVAVAATVLFLDEARKYLGKRFRAHASGR